jgi:transcriptional regulator with XRE-family HTH domain
MTADEEPPMTFGEFIKDLRIRGGYTLRRFCEAHQLDAGNYSKLERGLFPPPTGEEKMVELARALGLKPGTDDWSTFFDLAAATKGQFPKDLLSDAEVVSKLPVLFRTLRGEPVPPEKLDELIAFIKRP